MQNLNSYVTYDHIWHYDWLILLFLTQTVKFHSKIPKTLEIVLIPVLITGGRMVWLAWKMCPQ